MGKAKGKVRLDAETRALMGRIWREWVRPYRGRLLWAFALMAVLAASTGAYPLLIDQSYAMFETRDATRMALIPLAIIAVTMVKAWSMFEQTVVTSDIVQRVLTDVRAAMFDHLLDADMARVTAEPTGVLSSRFINDIDVLRNALSRTVTGLVRDILTVLALVGSMFYLDWMLSLVCFLIYPLAAVPIVKIGQRMRRVSHDTQAQMGAMTAFLHESLGGARMVKTYGLEAYERRRADETFQENYRLAMKATRQRSRLDPVMEVLGGVAVAAVIGFAGWRITTGAGTVGEFTGFIGALLIAAQPVRALGTLNTAVQEGLAAAQRVFQLIDDSPTILDAAGAVALAEGPGAVRLEGVRFAYQPNVPTLKDLNLDIAAGTTVALVGRSGAGKSTVFNLIPRLWDVTGGRVLIDGQDVRQVTLASLRRRIAVVSQDSVLFNDTIRANIAFGRLDASFAQIQAAAEAAAADRFISRLPQGYDTIVGDRGATLSGGERQRVALARAFLKDAPILLLDEATSALDAESERLVQDALARLTRGRTTLVIAHRLATVRDADVIHVLEDGRVVETGRHDELLAADGVYARLARLQFTEEGVGAATG